MKYVLAAVLIVIVLVAGNLVKDGHVPIERVGGHDRIDFLVMSVGEPYPGDYNWARTPHVHVCWERGDSNNFIRHTHAAEGTDSCWAGGRLMHWGYYSRLPDGLKLPHEDCLAHVDWESSDRDELPTCEDGRYEGDLEKFRPR